jgi:NAD(P)-dependent dehydrogenase (short-subunit alcohol dehydrogenase family)
MLLHHKVAVITGSGRGIDRDVVRRTAAEIRNAGGACLEVVADVSVESQVARLFAATLKAFGTLDILVNNAQMFVNRGESGAFLKMRSAGWNAYVRANMGILFHCTHQAARIMARRGVRGNIINISSNGANRVHRNLIAYDSVKGAIDTFTRAVAVDLAPWGIRCNALRPGMIAVDYWKGLSGKEKRRRIAAIPIGREGRPADIAWAAVFLAADDAGFVTGQNFEVDGGMLAPGRSASAELGTVNTPENIGDF